MFRLTIEAPTAEDLRLALIDAANQYKLPAPQINPDNQSYTPGYPAKAEEPKQAPVIAVDMAKPTPVKEPEPKVEAPKAEEPKPEAPAATQPTMEDARAALNKVREQMGVAAVKGILSQMGAAKFSDLTPEQYGDAIQRAGWVVGGNGK